MHVLVTGAFGQAARHPVDTGATSIARIWRGPLTTFSLKLPAINLTINGSAVKLKTRPLNAPAAA